MDDSNDLRQFGHLKYKTDMAILYSTYIMNLVHSISHLQECSAAPAFKSNIPEGNHIHT